MTHTIEFEFPVNGFFDRASFEDTVARTITCTAIFMQTDSLYHKYQLTSMYPKDFASIASLIGYAKGLNQAGNVHNKTIADLKQQVADLKTKLALAKQFAEAVVESNKHVLNILCDHNKTTSIL